MERELFILHHNKKIDFKVKEFKVQWNMQLANLLLRAIFSRKPWIDRTQRKNIYFSNAYAVPISKTKILEYPLIFLEAKFIVTDTSLLDKKKLSLRITFTPSP